MKLDRTKNTKKNILWGFVNKIINILLPFISRTLIIYELGINYVGLGSLFTSIISTLSLAEFGFDIAIVTVMYKSVADDENDSICSLLLFIKKAYLVVGTLILGIGLACIPFLKYLIKDASVLPSTLNLNILFALYLCSTVVSYFFGGYRACLFEVYQRQDVISNIHSLSKIIAFFVQILILIFTKNYYLYVSINIIQALINNLTVYFKSKKFFPEISPKGVLDRKEIDSVKKILGGTFLSKLGTVLSTTFDSIVISTFLGIIILGYYSNYSYIATSVQGFIVIIYTSMQAAFGNSVALESVESNYRNLEKFTFGYSWILGWSSLCLLYLYNPFINMWIGDKGLLPTSVVILIVVNFYISLCFGILGTYKNAIGIWWEDRYRCLISGIVNLILNVGLVLLLGRYGEIYSLAGIVLSTIITTAFIGIPWAAKVTFDVYFKNGLRNSMFNMIKYFSITCINAIINYPLMQLVDGIIVNHLAQFCIHALILCMVPNLFYYFVYRKSREMKEFKNFLVSIVRT